MILGLTDYKFEILNYQCFARLWNICIYFFLILQKCGQKKTVTIFKAKYNVYFIDKGSKKIVTIIPHI